MRLIRLFLAFLLTLLLFWIAPRLSKQRKDITYFETSAERFSLDHEAAAVYSSDGDPELSAWVTTPADTAAFRLMLFYHHPTDSAVQFQLMTRSQGSYDLYAAILPRLSKGDAYSYHIELQNIGGRMIARLPNEANREIALHFEGTPTLVIWGIYVLLTFLAAFYAFLALFDAVSLHAAELKLQKLSRKVLTATFFIATGAIVVGCLVSFSRFGYIWGGWPVDGNRSHTMMELLLLYWLVLTVLFKGTIFGFKPEKNIVSAGSAAVLTLLGVLFIITVYLSGDHFVGIPI